MWRRAAVLAGVLVAVLAVVLAILLPSGGARAAADVALRVYTGIRPIQYLVREVGGDRVEVEAVVTGSQSPETYEPGPRQLAALARSDIFFAVGLPLEAIWRRRIEDASALAWVDLRTAAPGRDHDHAGHPAADEDHPDHAGIDPHVWLSPPHAARMVTRIAETMAGRDPAHADFYRANAVDLRSRLQALHQEIGERLAASGVEVFLVYHPAWGHFAEAYGLTQIAIESQGKEPGPRGLASVIDKARRQNIRTLFVDPRHSDRLARTVAQAIDADVEILDPLAYDYEDNLRRAARAIAASRP